MHDITAESYDLRASHLEAIAELDWHPLGPEQLLLRNARLLRIAATARRAANLRLLGHAHNFPFRSGFG